MIDIYINNLVYYKEEHTRNDITVNKDIYDD